MSITARVPLTEKGINGQIIKVRNDHRKDQDLEKKQFAQDDVERREITSFFLHFFFGFFR